MAKHGTMQQVVLGTLAVMMVVSFVLAMASLVMPTNTYATSRQVGGGGITLLGVPHPREECNTGCCMLCQCGGCCGGYPCKCNKIGCIRRCDEYTNRCRTGWYCTSEPCNTGGCCP